MPNLLINYLEINGWIAQVANTNPAISYTFVGQDTVEQGDNVRLLAQLMQQGQQSLTDGVPNVFALGDGQDSAMCINQLFGSTDTITFVDRLIFSAAGDTVLEEIELAGRLLAAALP